MTITMARAVVCAFVLTILMPTLAASGGEFVMVKDGAAVCDIVIDTRGSLLSEPQTVADAYEARMKQLSYYYSFQRFASWLSERVEKSTGATISVLVDEQPKRASIVIGLAENYREVAEAAGLHLADRQREPFKYYDAFCIVSTPQRLYLLGHTELACRQAIAYLLNHMGHRFFNSSPRWWIAPQHQTLAVDLTMTHVPAFFNVAVSTKRGYDLNAGACGSGVIMWERGHVFALANHATGPMHFSSTHRVFIGPCTGRIVRDNKEQFDQHPEYFALLPDGSRNIQKNLYRSTLCLSNPDLTQLIAQDRVRKFKALRAKDRFAAMVTIEQAQGEWCQCETCTASPQVDVLFRFVNAVAREVRKAVPDGILGIRSINPPSFELEPNVYVGTRTSTLAAWRGKARLLGAGSPGPFESGTGLGSDRNFPGTPVAAHVDPYAQARETLALYRSFNVISTELGHQSFFGCQTPQLYVGLRMIWDPQVDVDALLDEYYALCFKRAAPVMRELFEVGYSQGDPPHPPARILGWCKLLDKAYAMEDDPAVRERVVDLMGYMHYQILLHEFDAVRARERTRDDAHYDALLSMMKYVASPERYRMMFNAGSLAFDFCKKEALADGRLDMYYHRWIREQQDPIWMDPKFPMRAGYDFRHMGDPEVLASYDDAKVIATFKADMAKLATMGEAW